MELPTAEVHNHSMLHVLSVLLAVIIGEDVSSFSKLMVSSAILESMISYARREGCGGIAVHIGVIAFVDKGVSIRFDDRGSLIRDYRSLMSIMLEIRK